MRLLTLFLLLATLLFADSDKHDHKEHHLPLDMSYLHLTSEQYTHAKAVVKSFKHEYKKFHHLKKETREAISKLFQDDEFDTEEFVRLTSALHERGAKIQAKFFSEMHAILTPAQKKRFAEYMEEWEVE